MKYLFTLITLAVLFAGCNKDDDQAEVDDNIIKQYLSDNNLDAEKHSSGLYYIITEPGSGQNPDINSDITIRYKGYFISGEVFDETSGNSTATFPLSALIQGWQIGIPLLKHGGSGQFFIPSELGYGDQQKGSIPANSVLIFDIDLVDFD